MWESLRVLQKALIKTVACAIYTYLSLFYIHSPIVLQNKKFLCRLVKFLEGPFLAARGFDTNLVQCLPPYYVIISNMHVCSFTCTISHVHRRTPKTVLRSRNLVYEKIIICEGLLWFFFLWPKTTVQLYILGYYSSVKTDFNVNNMRHRLPIVYTMLI